MEPFAALADWEAFFSAQVGAAATLAGLLFVGVSLNLSKILAADFLPLRAFLALLLLVAPLVIASLLLMPAQTRTGAGIPLIAIASGIWLIGTWVETQSWRRRTPAQHKMTIISNAALFEVAALSLITGSVLLLADRPAAPYWLGTAVILCYIKAVADSWVLLVEINR